MKTEKSRREFLQDVSLVGAALVAGGALAAAGCKKDEDKKDSGPAVADETCADGRKKVCAWIDERGYLFIDDEDLRTQLNQKLQAQFAAGKPNTGERYGIAVSWIDPGSTDNKMNSLCNC